MRDDSPKNPVNWFELDRLVDGQLDQAEYRELLRQVEKDPDGWRQCALAFLQHQALQQELQAISSDPTHPWADAVPGCNVETSPSSAVAAPEIRRTLVRGTRLLGGVAVALLVGVTLGVAVRPADNGIDVPGPDATLAESGFPQAVATARELDGFSGERQLVDSMTTPFDDMPRVSPTQASLSYGEARDGLLSEDPFLGSSSPGDPAWSK